MGVDPRYLEAILLEVQCRSLAELEVYVEYVPDVERRVVLE
jgi:hypothetical protein